MKNQNTFCEFISYFHPGLSQKDELLYVNLKPAEENIFFKTQPTKQPPPPLKKKTQPMKQNQTL